MDIDNISHGNSGSVKNKSCNGSVVDGIVDECEQRATEGLSKVCVVSATPNLFQ